MSARSLRSVLPVALKASLFASLYGLIGGVLAIYLFVYRYYIDHAWSWDLFAAGMTIVSAHDLVFLTD
jgi:hypothetical protein